MILLRAIKVYLQPVLIRGRGAVTLWVLIAATMVLGACAETQFIAQTVKKVSKKAETETRADGSTSSASSSASAMYKIGKPYQIKNVWYYPKVDYQYDETGIGSWYGAKFHGHKTANGEIYDMNSITAAHKTLPLPSMVRVTNLENGRTLNIRVNDRGPYAHGRILDLSRRAAQLLGFQRQGTASIRVRILAKESRILATRMKGQADLAKIGTPITIQSTPKPIVVSQNLPVIGNSLPTMQPAPPSIPAPTPVDEGAPASGDQSAALQVDQKVTIEPVNQLTRIFVQAGAYSNFSNANRVRAVLSSIGSVKVSPILINGIDLFRVRVGPVKSVAQADHILEQVIAAGYTDARTIVD